MPTIIDPPTSPIIFASGVALSVGANPLGDTGFFTAGYPQPKTAFIIVEVTAIATGPVVVTVEYSYDGTNWFTADTAQSFASISATKRTALQVALAWPRFRLNANLTAGTCTLSARALVAP